MKCYGYSKKDSDTLLEMAEITLQANPQSLKSFADFLYDCAEKIETDSEWEHDHFQDSKHSDSQPENESFDLIVYRL